MPLALPARPAGAASSMARLLGGWNNPNPAPARAIRQAMSASLGMGRQQPKGEKAAPGQAEA